MTSRQDLLDQYIDARNAGEAAGTDPASDPELRHLIETVDRIQSPTEIEWPDGDFPARLSQRLHAELRPGESRSQPAPDFGLAPAATGGVAEPPADAGGDDQGCGWRWYTRQFAGMAAAALVIGLFGLGLAFILGDWGGEISAPGAAVEPGQIRGTLLYTEYGNGEQTIARVDADGTDQQDLATRWSPRHDVSDLAWSPDGETIAYFDPAEPDRDAPARISLVGADGDEIGFAEAGQFHGMLRLDTQLSWSSSGSSLAFAHLVQENERMRVSVVHPETGEIQTTGSGQDSPDSNDAYPAWAPDQWALAFARNEGENQRSIQLIREGMSQPMPLVEGRPRANQPAWSPNGESIVYIDSPEDDERSSIYTVDVDSRETERVTDHERWDYSPTWSSRDRIAFMSDHGDRDYDILLVEPDGSELRNITEDYDWPAYLPDWSDDGRYLTFSSHNQDQNRWRINVYDVEEDQLYTVHESENPLFASQWRPEGPPDDLSDLPEDADVEGNGWSREQLDLMRRGAEQYLAEDDDAALTVNGEEITAGQVELRQATAELNRDTTEEAVEEMAGNAPEMAEYQSGMLELIEEYGPENVGLSALMSRAAVQVYAEENDLVATDEQIDEALERQRETHEMIREQDPESAAALNEALIDVLGEDRYWEEYLPEALQESLTEQNVHEAVWEAADINAREETILRERQSYIAGFRADLVREAEIEIHDEDALGGADLDRAIEYITEAYPALQQQRQSTRGQSVPTVTGD